MQETSNFGFPIGSEVDGVWTLKAWDIADLATLKAEESDRRAPGRIESVRAMQGRRFYWHPTSLLTGDDQLVVRPTDVAADKAGRWLALPGQIVDLEFAFTYETADGATLYTLPTSSALLVQRGYWEITTACTGGSSSAIGLDSDQTGFTTPGDLLGGASGDVEATLVTGDYILGTVGAKQATGILLVGGKVVRYQRITSAFTAGAGKAHLVGALLANPGA